MLFRSVVVSDDAKDLAKRIPAFTSDYRTKTGKPKKARLSAIHIQHLMNNYTNRGIDWRTLDWGTFDNSLTVTEAITKWESRELKGRSG